MPCIASTGKLLANMHRSTPNDSRQCSIHGANASSSIEWSGMARPDSLQCTLSPNDASAEIPRFHSANSSGESSRGQPACSTTTVSSPHSASAAAELSSRSGCAMSSNTRSRSASARRTSSGGTPNPPPIGRMPRNRGDAICSSSNRSVSAIGSSGTMPPMMASGWPVASASSSSSAVSSPEWPAVAAATCTNFTTL